MDLLQCSDLCAGRTLLDPKAYPGFACTAFSYKDKTRECNLHNPSALNTMDTSNPYLVRLFVYAHAGYVHCL